MSGEEESGTSVSLEERIEKLIAQLEQMKKMLEGIALDEMCEAKAYRDMAKACIDEQAKWELFLIAFDSIVHREIAWALMRAVTATIMFARDLLLYKPSSEEAKHVLEMVETHISMEKLAESSYEDLVPLAEPGTTLRKLLELLVEEEKKHARLAESVIKRLKSRVEETK
jgi:hypothetical protein